MKLITSHIEYLLTENDCVIVPGFGGFVMQRIAAQFSADEVLPPSCEICFNSGLTHDDGLLLNSISQVLAVSYTESRRMIQNELDLFYTELSFKSNFVLGKIGVFSLDEQKNLAFESSTKSSVDIEAFGLSAVKMLHLKELNQREEPSPVVEKKDPDIIQIRFSKRKALRNIASVAVVLLLWMLSTPVSDVSKTACAGFITRNQVIKMVEKSAVAPTKDSVAVASVVPAKPVEVVDAESKPIKEVSVEDKYFVVLGSFQSETSANRHLEQLTKAGVKDVQVQKLGTLMRTTLRGFSEKDAAEKYLQSIRYERDEFHEAWLYCKK